MLSHENLSALFAPVSVAVAGASRHPGKTGDIVLANIMGLGLGGKIFPINPKGDTVLGLQAYRKAADIPARHPPPDLAVIRLPAAQAPEAVWELGLLPARGHCRQFRLQANGRQGAAAASPYT
jgi:acyl-CoA synthetase (NDP forming)